MLVVVVISYTMLDGDGMSVLIYDYCIHSITHLTCEYIYDVVKYRAIFVVIYGILIDSLRNSRSKFMFMPFASTLTSLL